MKKKAHKAGADMEVANEIGQPNQSTQLSSHLDDSIGLAPQKLRNSVVRELTIS